MKNVIILGAGDTGKQLGKTLQAYKNDNSKIIIIEPEEDTSTITINGIKYTKKEKEKINIGDSSIRNLNFPETIYQPYLITLNKHNLEKGGEKQDISKLNIDIVKEFELIQQKKSNLSKSQRDWVVIKFNKVFVEVPEKN